MPRTVAEIDADLTEAYADRKAASKVASYSINGRAKTSQTLTALNEYIASLQTEREIAAALAAGEGSLTFTPVIRGF